MDQLDLRIIEILQHDGRTSNARVAREVGVSEGTVRRRLNRLIDGDFIDVVAVPDPVKMGLASRALIGVQIDPDKIDRVADDLNDLKEIAWVTITTGTFDVFAWPPFPRRKNSASFCARRSGRSPACGAPRPSSI